MHRRTSGFTLIEMMVVLAIVALVIATAVPMMGGAVPGAELRTAARDVAAGLRRARSLATTESRDMRFVLDTDARRFTVTGDGDAAPAIARALPASLELSLFTVERERVRQAVGAIRFFPDGGSTGGRVRVAREKQFYDVDVDWLTGAITTGR